jgi:hypothetical protein
VALIELKRYAGFDLVLSEELVKGACAVPVAFKRNPRPLHQGQPSIAKRCVLAGDNVLAEPYSCAATCE